MNLPQQPQDYPIPEEWMLKAADEIDVKLGLPRMDQAPEWCARIIALHYAQHVAELRPETRAVIPIKSPTIAEWVRKFAEKDPQ